MSQLVLEGDLGRLDEEGWVGSTRVCRLDMVATKSWAETSILSAFCYDLPWVVDFNTELWQTK